METQIDSIKAKFFVRESSKRPQNRAVAASFGLRSRSNHSMLRPTVAYLRAMREADLAVVNFARKYSQRQTTRSFSTSLN